MITLDEARARGIALPADDAVAQDIVDEQEAWLAQRIGPLEGSRTETFQVGYGVAGRLSLRRFTDAVAVTDNGAAIADADLRLVDNGAGIERVISGLPGWWVGPYIAATYTPNDSDLVRRALFDLCAIAVEPVSSLTAEQIGSYSYSRPEIGTGAQARALIVAGILPRRGDFAILSIPRDRLYGDALINRPEFPT